MSRLAGTVRALRTLAVGAAIAITAASCATANGSPAPQTSAVSAVPSAAVATLPVTTTPPAVSTTTAPASVTPSVAPTASASGSATVLALGKKVFQTAGPAGKGCQECHGVDGKGSLASDGTQAPNIRGTTEQKLRAALAGSAALMTNIKLSDQEIEAVIAYLQFLDLQ